MTANLPTEIGGYPQPQSVAIAGDWHGSGRWAAHAIRRVMEYRPVDAVVHAGDFGFWPGRGGQAFLDDLESALAGFDLPLYWVDGNHEDHDGLGRIPIVEGVRTIRPHIIHLPRGFRWTWQGQTWLAFGGAVSIDRDLRSTGVDWWPGEMISDLDVEAAVAGGPADIMICHDCPRGVPELDQWLSVNGVALPPIIASDANHSRAQVRRVVDAARPGHLFHGHYHHRYAGRLDGDGYTTAVIGLDCDGTTTRRNVVRLELPLTRVRSLFDD